MSFEFLTLHFMNSQLIQNDPLAEPVIPLRSYQAEIARMAAVFNETYAVGQRIEFFNAIEAAWLPSEIAAPAWAQGNVAVVRVKHARFPVAVRNIREAVPH